MKTKKYYFKIQIAVLLMVLCIGVSCSSDDDDPYLSVSVSDETDFDANGGKKDIMISSNVEWKLTKTFSGTAGWLMTTTERGNGNMTISAVANMNNSTEERTVTLKFVCTTDEKVFQELSFKQVGVAPILKLSSYSISFPTPYKSTKTLKIESNMPWTASVDNNWLSLSANSGLGNATIEVNITENTGDDERKALITFSGSRGQLAQQVEVTQDGMGNLYYREPFVTWGATIDATKSYMSGYEIVKENESQLLYEAKYKEEYTGYYFDYGQLSVSVVMLSTWMLNTEALLKQLQNNGYQPSGTTSSDLPIFVSDDNKTLTIFDNRDSKMVYMNYYDYIHLFKPPFTAWLTNYDKLKTVMESRGYEVLTEGVNTDGTLYIGYSNTHLELFSLYLFNTSSKLQEVDLFLDPSITPYDKVCRYLTSELSFQTSNFTSSLGNVYDSSDGNTVVVVVRPSVDTDDLIVLSFLSYNEVYSIVHSNSRHQTRNGIIDIVLNRYRKLLKENLQHLSK